MSIPKAFYENDERINLYQLKEQLAWKPEFIKQVEMQSQSVGCLVHKDLLIEDVAAGTFKISGLAKTTEKELGLGPNERFREELSTGRKGTAFLIDREYALTAAHCVCYYQTDRLNFDCIKKIRLLFGFQMKSATVCKTEFEKKDCCKVRVVDHKWSRSPGEWTDWALLKLKGTSNRIPLPLSSRGISIGKKLYLLGHHDGAPLKFSGHAEITAKAPQREDLDYFESDLSAFRGSSGGPVFDEETQEVIGILCEGNQDYKWVNGYGYEAYRPTAVDIEKGGREKSQPLAGVLVKNYLKAPHTSHPSRLGLSLKGRCTIASCGAEFLVELGHGEHDIAREMFRSKCSQCQKKIRGIEAFIFFKCEYTIEAMLEGNKKPLIEKGETSDQELLPISNFCPSKWTYIQVTTEKK